MIKFLRVHSHYPKFLFCVLLMPLLLVACGAGSGDDQSAKQNLVLANTYVQQGLYDKASDFFQKALTQEPESLESLYGLAMIAERRRDAEGALGYYRKIIAIDPQQKAAHLSSGLIYLLQNKPEKAAEVAEALLEIAADDPEVSLFRVRVLGASQQLEKALPIARGVVEQDPQNIQAVLLLSNIYMNTDRADMAIEAIDKAIASQPEVEVGPEVGAEAEEAKTNAEIRLLSLYQQKIRILSALARLKEVEALYRSLLVKYPNNPAIYLQFAGYYLGRDNPETAKVIIEPLAQQDDLQVDTVLAVSEFYRRAGEPQMALQVLQRYQPKYKDNGLFSLTLAQQHVAVGDEEAAREIFQPLHKRLSKEESDAGMLVRVATSYAAFEKQSGHPDKARQLVDGLLAQIPNSTQGLLSSASLDMDDKNYRSAIARSKTILDADASNVTATLILARAYTDLKQHSDAVTAFEKALEVQPNNKLLVLGYIETLLAAADYNKAYNLANKWLKQFPEDTELLLRQIDVCIKGGLYTRLPELVSQLEKVQGQSSYSRYAQGVAEAATKNFQQAISAFKQSLSLNSNNEQAAASLLRVYQVLKQTEAATAYFKTLAADDNPVAYMILGQLYQSQQAYNEAAGYYRQVLTIAPENPRGYAALANVYSAQNKLTEAQSILREGIEKTPQSWLLFYQLGSVLLASDRKTEAMTAYKTSVELNSSNTLAVNNYISLLSDAVTDKQQLLEAEPWVQQLSEINDHRIYDTIAWFYYKLGDYYKASLNIEKAIAANDQEALYHYHAGMIYQAQKRPDKAQSSLKKALDLAGDTSNNESWVKQAKELLGNNSPD